MKGNKDKTYRRRLQVVNPNGIHLRAAGEIVKLTSKYECEVSINFKGRTANGKSLMSILSLALHYGASFSVNIKGQGSAALMREFVKKVETGFGEGTGEEQQ